ncbi:MAG TPA: SLC13 family permease [Gemmatimonadota bacterium]|nr:SLC13 family permease [Gemmatimonadota bacterium]
MTPEIALLLSIVGIAIVLFAFERIPADLIGLGIMLSLVLTGILVPEQAFAGFGSDTVMMILGLLIMTAALLRTGVVEMAGRAILRRGGTDPDRLLVLVTVSVAALSAFISNTAAAAFFLPIVMGVALRSGASPSRFLLPMAFAAILTSPVTLISTSSNMVVSGLMTDYGMEPIGMFELAPVGIPIAVVGLVYLLTVGRRLIPSRPAPRDLAEEFGLGPYLTEVVVLAKSKLAGKTLAESGFGRDLDLTVLRILRGGKKPVGARAETRLEEGDVLIVEGRRDEILKIKETGGLDIRPDVELGGPAAEGEDLVLAEGMVLPGSPLIGRTLRSTEFRERHGLQVLAIHRHGETLRDQLSRVRLRLGDALLVQGDADRLAELEAQNVLAVVGAERGERPRLGRAWLAIGIFVASIAAATLGVLPLAVAFMTGALVTMATRCITPQEAYRDIEWKVLILIGSMLALGVAMEETGTAELLAGGIVEAAGGASPYWLLSGFFLLTVVLTQPMSNQAAAIVVLPLAIETALAAGLEPRTFAMMVAVAASVSYLTPLEPACLMVYGPGRYRFFDFLKVGAPLTVAIYLIAIALVPLVWPLGGAG